MALPKILITVNNWTLSSHPSPEEEPWSLDQCLSAVKEAGFDAFSCRVDLPGAKEAIARSGLRYGGFFDAFSPDDYASKIQDCLAIGDGPINCQFADHDTLPEEAIPLLVKLNEEAEARGAYVHLEVHRDTCTETPEKTAAIIAGYREQTGKTLLVNFDYSHPAVVKHLGPENYIERLFDDVETFQRSRLWHIRPFNGHHCQVPITNGSGNFSPEYADCRPFIKQAFRHWLKGPRPGNEFWVVPELGPQVGYGLSCMPNIWEDAIVLGNDLRTLWADAIEEA